MPRKKGRPAWRELVAQMTHFFALMLWGAAGLALLAGLPPLAAAIAVIVLLNGVFAFVQEHRADRAAEKLRDLMPALTRVVRDGRPLSVPVTDVVVGDVVLLAAGDRVPADLSLVVSDDLAVDESMLTGESVAVRRGPGSDVYAGTYVLLGEGEGTVGATGARTRLAQMAALTGEAQRPPSPLDVELGRLVRIIAVIALSVGVVLATVALLLGDAVTAALLFGVGVTVALVPEGLLPTVTLSLASGAQRMADRRALVRHLQAVETLGATTFICTDKTGTLTRNVMAVVEVWTPEGTVVPRGVGYEPTGTVAGPDAALRITAEAARGARACVTGRAVAKADRWVAEGDPMDVALDVPAARMRCDDVAPSARLAFSHERMFSAAAIDATAYVLGAPEAVLRRCQEGTETATAQLNAFADAGRRVIAVARARTPVSAGDDASALERAAGDDLDLLGLMAIEDPPRDGVQEALETCRTAGIRVAMGQTGSDVARQAADLVLLDDHFETIVNAIELGRATYANIRRFLTFHLTDNVAELAPFALWALSAGSIPPALNVLQVLALDIGTDMLPALGLGAEPANARTMQGPRREERIASGSVLRRAFLVLGPTEAVMSLAGFLWVLSQGGWSVGETPDDTLLASASGTAFAAIAVGQVANAFACRSETRPVWRIALLKNRLVLAAVAVELVLLVGFLTMPGVADLLGGSWPPPERWLWAAATGVAVLVVDAVHKELRRRRRGETRVHVGA